MGSEGYVKESSGNGHLPIGEPGGGGSFTGVLEKRTKEVSGNTSLWELCEETWGGGLVSWAP